MKKRRTNASAPRQKRPEKTAREQAWQRFLRQNTWLVLLLGFLIGGVLTGVLGSAISMGKYLKEENNAD